MFQTTLGMESQFIISSRPAQRPLGNTRSNTMKRYVGHILQASGNAAKVRYQAFTLNHRGQSPIYQSMQKALDWLETKVGIRNLELDGSGLKRGWVGYRALTRQDKKRRDRLLHASGIRFHVGAGAEVMLDRKWVPMDEQVADNVVGIMKTGLLPGPLTDDQVLALYADIMQRGADRGAEANNGR